MTESIDWDVASGVGFTALLAAAGRAVEAGREQALVRDPYAAAFVRAARLPRPMPLSPEAADADASFPWADGSQYIAVRSRFFDDYLAAAVSAPAPGSADAAIRQVVLLAAGLDARAFRMEWPAGVTVLEVDAPQVLAFKAGVLADDGARAACSRREVGADLRADWTAELLAAGLRPTAPTAWLAEGLLIYLPGEAKERLLAAVTDLSAPGSQIAIEHVSDTGSGRQGNAAFRDAVARTASGADVDVDSLWHDRPDLDPAEWLRAHGWTAHAHPSAGAAEGYGRPLPASLPEGMLTAQFITARRGR
jgi:methyltransferase (TIGR00027 family)